MINLSKLAFLIFIFGCTVGRNETLLDNVSGDSLPTISLEKIHEDLELIKLSSIIKDISIIPLETGDDFLLNNLIVADFSNEFILVGNHSQSGARVYLFDSNGMFIREIGSVGRGPGEHTGTEIGTIRYYNSDSLVLIQWSGQGDYPQLFDINGNFLENIRTPFRSQLIERFSDSIWFSVGNAELKQSSSLRDSIRFISFTQNGQVLQKAYKPSNHKIVNGIQQYMTIKNIPYLSFGSWKIHFWGNDTLYKLSGNDLQPLVLFKSDEYSNDDINKNGSDRPPTLEFLAETKGDFLIRRTLMTNRRIEDYYGLELVKYDQRIQLLIINKQTGKVINVSLQDDVFNLFESSKLIPLLLSDNGSLYFSVSANEFLNLKGNTSYGFDRSYQVPDNTLQKLHDLSEISNPILFRLSLKDSIDIY